MPGEPPPPVAAKEAPLPGTVKALGLTSLCNDLSSEFLYPFLPAFLTGVLGASKPALAYGVGKRSDRGSRKTAIIIGWTIYAFVYAGFAMAGSAGSMVVLFLLYGLYHAFAEGVERAFVADLVPGGERDRAYAWFAGVAGAAALPASLGAGLLWQAGGATWALGAGAALALAATGMLAVWVPAGRS